MAKRLIPYAAGALGALVLVVVAGVLDWTGITTITVGAAAVFIAALIGAPWLLGRRGEAPVTIIREEVRVITERPIESQERLLRRSRSAVTAGAPRGDGHPSGA